MTSVPDPTTVLIVPAATPARRTASASQTRRSGQLHRRLVGGRRGGSGGGAAGATSRVRAAGLRRRGGLLGGADRLLHLSCAWDSVESGTVGGSIVGAMSTRLSGPSVFAGMPAISWIEEPRPSSALVNSEGTIQTLLASPSAIFGIIWRYW